MSKKDSASSIPFSQGPVRKGGVKPRPSSPKPDVKPSGQNPPKAPTKK